MDQKKLYEDPNSVFYDKTATLKDKITAFELTRHLRRRIEMHEKEEIEPEKDIEWFRSNHLDSIGPIMFFTGADHKLSVAFMVNKIDSIVIAAEHKRIKLMAFATDKEFVADLPDFTPEDLPRLQGFVNEIWLDALMALKHY